jgi:Raf kinase inhibitor-like YbhB/YbcL family protein
MKLVSTLLLATSIVATAYAQQAAAPAKAPARPGLTLTSSSFEDGGIIPNKFTQADPAPVSPKLDWTNVPQGAVTFALIMHDPDTAPQKKSEDILHWMAFNIPGTSTGLQEGVATTATLPDGTVQAKSFRGAVGYMGPGAPAPGPYHHYTFELYALDTKLALTPDATRADVIKAMDGHVVAKAALTGRFHRP